MWVLQACIIFFDVVTTNLLFILVKRLSKVTAQSTDVCVKYSVANFTCRFPYCACRVPSAIPTFTRYQLHRRLRCFMAVINHFIVLYDRVCCFSETWRFLWCASRCSVMTCQISSYTCGHTCHYYHYVHFWTQNVDETLTQGTNVKLSIPGASFMLSATTVA